MQPLFRRATPADAEAAVPLVYRSGPAAFDHVFAGQGHDAQGFLRAAFRGGRGLFSCQRHWLGEVDGEVVVAGTAFGGGAALGDSVVVARQMLGHYRLRAPGAIRRGLQVERVIAPPPKGVWYLAHLGVAPGATGQGIGSAFIGHLLAQGRAAGFGMAALDVADDNPRARRLYERLGFARAKTRASRIPAVADHHFMVLPL